MSDDGWSAWRAQMLGAVDAGRRDVESLRSVVIQALTELAAQKADLSTIKGEVGELRKAERVTLASNVRVGVMWAALGAALTAAAAYIIRGGHP